MFEQCTTLSQQTPLPSPDVRRNTNQGTVMRQQVRILDVLIDNISRVDLLEQLKSGGTVFTPNVDHLMKLQKDPEFYEAYLNATYRTCDSQILIFASMLLGNPIQERISGSDLFPAFYEHYAHDEDIRIFLLGAAEGVAAKAMQRINRKVGRDIIVAAHSPSFGFENDEAECNRIIDMINESGATVLAIGVGAPKQEKWICKHKSRLKNIKIFFAIGATIDFEAGNVPRAPKWMSEAGLEWLYRLLLEPKRLWKRYLIEDVPFLLLVLKQALKRDRPLSASSPNR